MILFPFTYQMGEGGHGGSDCMVVGFTTTYVISAFHLLSCEFEPCLRRAVC